jgi:hypothetical protein
MFNQLKLKLCVLVKCLSVLSCVATFLCLQHLTIAVLVAAAAMCKLWVSHCAGIYSVLVAVVQLLAS